MSTKSERSWSGASSNVDPAPRDYQQARLLEILGRRAGEPVTYAELQAAGIEFPASVVAELELAGAEIERCRSAAPGGRPVRAVRLTQAVEQIARHPRSGTERELAAPPASDWGRMRRYHASRWRALGANWVDRGSGSGLAAPAPPARSVRLRSRGGTRLLAPLALLVAIVAIALVVAGTSGGKAHSTLRVRRNPRSASLAHVSAQGRAHVRSGRPAASRVATTRRQAIAASPAASSTASQSQAPADRAPVSTSSVSDTSPAGSASGASASGADTPSGAVQAFYEDAAHHQYGAAWALADANMRDQVGGYFAFEDQMSSVRAIAFHEAQVLDEGSDSATVAVQTTSVQADRTQQCWGSVRTVRTGSGWLLDGISISCS